MGGQRGLRRQGDPGSECQGEAGDRAGVRSPNGVLVGGAAKRIGRTSKCLPEVVWKITRIVAGVGWWTWRFRAGPYESLPGGRMATTFYYMTTLATLAVFAVLVAGLWAMSKEGTASLSQKLMRWRVGLQFFAIIIIMLAVYFKRGM
jgi:hypothetical protein